MRILFLETIAGVPGMVAATLRHLSSLRLMVSALLSAVCDLCVDNFAETRFWVCHISFLILIISEPCARWIHTLLEEAENERMHLMFVVHHPDWIIASNEQLSRTFMTLKDPSLFFRAIILGAQGVFYNLFCECSRTIPFT